MKIAIIGTRGIPNHYGGFEQFAEYLSVYLADHMHDVVVYSSHSHPYQKAFWKNVKILHRFDPEYLIGTVGQFIYDLNCIWHTRRQGFDVILQLGYTSSSIWSFLIPKSSIVITNMDGLEWRRAKYGKIVRKFLRFAEKLAVKGSNVLVADSLGIQRYLRETYNVSSCFIPYGATVFDNAESAISARFDLINYNYSLLIARMEPENNIEVILDGVVESGLERPFLVIGSTKNTFGRKMLLKYKKFPFIRFIGPLYDINYLNNLRYFSNLYFHGHSVGGTNPSLLEAMASGSLICAHNNIFNRAILNDDAHYFDNASDVAEALKAVTKNGDEMKKIDRNLEKIKNIYNWPIVNAQYLDLFVRTTKKQV